MAKGVTPQTTPTPTALPTPPPPAPTLPPQPPSPVGQSYIYSIVALAALGAAGVVSIQFSNFTSGEKVGATSSLLAFLMAAFGFLKSAQNGVVVEQTRVLGEVTHKLVNSEVAAWKEEMRKSSIALADLARAQGFKQGGEEERNRTENR